MSRCRKEMYFFLFLLAAYCSSNFCIMNLKYVSFFFYSFPIFSGKKKKNTLKLYSKILLMLLSPLFRRTTIEIILIPTTFGILLCRRRGSFSKCCKFWNCQLFRVIFGESLTLLPGLWHQLTHLP